MGIKDIFGARGEASSGVISASAPFSAGGFMPSLAGDPIKRLPRDAAAKLRHLREKKDAAYAALEAASVRRSQMYSDRAGEKNELPRYKDVHEKHPGRMLLEARITDIEIEIQHAETAYNHRATTWKGLAELVERVEKWVKSLRTDARIEMHGATPSIKRPSAEALSKARTDMARLRDELAVVQSAPAPLAAAKQAVKSFVEQLTRAGAPDCFALTSPYPQDRKLEFPTTALRTKVFGGGPGIDGLVVGGVDPLALLAWVLGPEKVLARLNEEIELRCNDPHAITDEDRAKRVSELNAKILEAERQEEAIVCALESDGMTIARRPDADPRAILTLASTLPPPEQI